MESLLSSIDSFNWDELKSFDHVDDALDFFYKKLFQMIEDHVPKKKYTPATNLFPVWFTASIKRNIRSKNFYRSKWLRTRNQNCRGQFVRLRALINSEISTAYDDYVTSIMEKMKLDPKIFWKFINQKKNCSRIPGVMYVDEEPHDDPQAVVNIFAEHFSELNVEAVDEPENIRYTSADQYPPVIVPEISEDEIKSIMSNFPNKTTSGDNGIPSFFLRNYSAVLAKPLTIIINFSLKNCIFPSQWKRARVVPIFKKGNNAHVHNYRPISILSNFAKVYEEVLYRDIYFSVHSYLSTQQHGFIRGRSTVTNLATISQYIT
ncbi:uncharacterized protein LOC123678693 [Harmonia axyridis]|uniref:uncharacterized protein LOC123678693 n=1 Tax=Harmonia axyridis TaxID=115357 RepID=UPI001E275190|nr:uncharacterized protein LOC123678693 [Harmonia axyridis]